MSDNEYTDDTESRFDWARQLIAQAETPAPKRPARPAPTRRTAPARRVVTASRRRDGSFRPDTNVIQVRPSTDGMAVYNLRQAVGM